MINFKNDAKKVLLDNVCKTLFMKYQRESGMLFAGYSVQKKELYNAYYSQKENVQEKIDEAYDLLINGPLNNLIHEKDLNDLILIDLHNDAEKNYIGISDFYIINSDKEIIAKLKMFDLFMKNKVKNCPTFQYIYSKENVKSSSVLTDGFDESFFYNNKLKSKFDNSKLIEQKDAILKLCLISSHINIKLTFEIEFFDLDSVFELPNELVPSISMFVQGNSYPKNSIISEIYNENPYQMLFDSLHNHMKVRLGVNNHIELESIITNAEKINKILKDKHLNTIGFEINEMSHLHTKIYKCIKIKDIVLSKYSELIIPFPNEVSVENLFKNKIHLIVDFKDYSSDFYVNLSDYINNPKEILEYMYLNGY